MTEAAFAATMAKPEDGFDAMDPTNVAPLVAWLASEDSRRVGQKDGNGESVGHQSGRRIVELLHRPAAELSEDDLAHMRKVVAYVHRHLAQGPSKSDPATSDWRYSLMNWGHDPQKK